MEDEKFLKIAVKVRTKKQVRILTAINGGGEAQLVGLLVDQVWQQALAEGLVNNAMLQVDEGLELPGRPAIYVQHGSE